jgi:endonuclease YncB( thermonuclease family)
MRNKILLISAIAFFFLSCNNSVRHRKHDNRAENTVENVIVSENRRERPTQLEFKRGDEFLVRVVGVSDGDTFTGLTADNQQVRCRIYGIDAPESRQAFGNRSKQALSDLIYDKQITIKIHGRHFQRAIVRVYTAEGKDISAEMIRIGMAWHYKQYSKDVEYAELENAARQQQIGLWADKNPIEPWLFRRNR